MSLPMGMFYALAAANLCVIAEEPSGTTAVAMLMSDLVLGGTVALWVMVDASRRGRPLPHIMGLYLLVFPILLIPLHLFRTRGWRGFIPLGVYLLIWLAAIAATAVPYSIWFAGE